MTQRTAAEDALVACRRRCCLCEELCGTKIEIHHIDPGGGDDPDNLIPLCFKCHAEVGHYNIRHPRGRKFTPAELKRHRDQWYKKVSMIRIDDSNGHREVDRETFKALLTAFAPDGGIQWVRGFFPMGLFSIAGLMPLRAAAFDHLRRADLEFLDDDLEKMRQAFLKGIFDLHNAITGLARPARDPLPGNEHLWECWPEQHRDFDERMERIRILRNELVEGYDDMLRAARRRLVC